MLKCVVYQQRSQGAVAPVSLPEGYEYSVWRPGLMRVVPPGLPRLRFAAWWLMWFLGAFSNRDYSVLMIHSRGKLVHRSVVSPGYFRFPFMAAQDLQIGDTWTREEQRGKGLAGFAIQAIQDRDTQPDRVYWYVCEETNIASIRVVEKLGFSKAGHCVRVSRFGLRLLGAFIIAVPAQLDGSGENYT